MEVSVSNPFELRPMNSHDHFLYSAEAPITGPSVENQLKHDRFVTSSTKKPNKGTNHQVVGLNRTRAFNSQVGHLTNNPNARLSSFPLHISFYFNSPHFLTFVCKPFWPFVSSQNTPHPLKQLPYYLIRPTITTCSCCIFNFTSYQ
jgi:hypothetical protein